jgi:hypothetical protein
MKDGAWTVTFSRLSEALAVRMKGLGFSLWWSMAVMSRMK